MSTNRVRASHQGCVWLAALGGMTMLPEKAEATLDLGDMSIEELAQIEVTSVSKSPQRLSDAAAAVYVITNDEIVRSGARSLPEILRLAPNLHVAQINASRYAISARGFNGGAADKLLVLVDGRSIYTPFSSSVNWDLQEVPPETIERIEVVRGPGGTLWGANAVNGVINIITRKSSDTQGGAVTLGGGNTEARADLHYGGRITERLSYRAYVTGFRHGDRNRTGAGANARDGWEKVQGGLRLDWDAGPDLVTVQGDIYDGSEHQRSTADQAISGHNLLARWTHAIGDGSSLELQAYYDHIDISVPDRARNRLDTYDIQAQHSFPLGRHDIIWGGGYRLMRDDFPTVLSPTQTAEIVPQSRTLDQWNLFIQSSFSLRDDLKLIVGIKVEDEPYTGIEVMPNVRLAWTITESDLLWLSVSRAVRVPSRLDREVRSYNFSLPTGPILVLAGGDMQANKVNAYELGYRAQPSPRFSFSIAGFYNVYPNLRSVELTNNGLPAVFGNGIEGETYGVEFWANYRVADWWRLRGGANWLHKDLRFKPGSDGLIFGAILGGLQISGDDPDYQFSLRSAMDLGEDITFDVQLRHVGSLPAPPSPAYTELGARLAWAASDRLELSVTGSNLLHDHHAEFGTTSNTLQVGPIGVRVKRSVFFATRWRF